MNKQLPLKTKLGFGVCDLGGNLYFTVIAFWLTNYLTDQIGLAAGLAGFSIMIGKLWDAITDPVVGFFSDRTKSRWGRRRPYMFIGAFALFVSMIVMFTNPQMTNQIKLFIWASMSFIFLSTAYTLVNIPYSAITPELTTDFNERTTLNGFRMGFAVVGTLLGAGVAIPIVGLFSNKNTGYSVMGIIFGALMMITALITVFAIKEKQPVAKPTIGIIKTYLSTFKNKPFLLILFPWALHITGITIVSGSFIYYYKYIYHAEKMVSIAMFILIVTAGIFIPIWVLISKKIGKKNSYNIGMILVILSTLAFFFIGHRIGVKFSLILMFLTGIGLAAHYVMPWAMIPDTIEYDYSKSKERREGVYYGIWTFLTKLGQAFAGLTIGITLSFFHYAPKTVTPQVEFGIRLLIGPFPAIFFISGVIILFLYPIDKEKYQKILEKIKKID